MFVHKTLLMQFTFLSLSIFSLVTIVAGLKI
ncbi:hypothetical protein KSF78_0009549 [Schistosoma japonicum]|nr:hypothetical protein KSF78_0009549 [Schistosoma japonicum]